MNAIFIRDYNSGREKFPESPMYQTFDAYMIERLKSLIWSINGAGIHEKGE